MLPRSDKNLTS